MASVYVYGCVDWDTGVVHFDPCCSYCDSLTGCVSHEGDEHDGQIAVTVNLCGCSDTYYACVWDWNPIMGHHIGYNFRVSISPDCIGFGGCTYDEDINVELNGIVDCDNCVAAEAGKYVIVTGVDAYVNGLEVRLDKGGGGGNYCWWGREMPGSAINVRVYSTSNCTGPYTDYDSGGVFYRIYKAASVLEVAVCVESYVWAKMPVFFNNDENDCCFQELDNETVCSSILPASVTDDLCTCAAVCDSGTATLTQYIP